MDDDTTGHRQRARDRNLSHHILPSAATMIGICTTLIGLVKISEARNGASRADEFAALAALLFLLSAIASYMSLRAEFATRVSSRLERAADLLFLLGLISLSAIAVLFAYEIM